MRQNHQLNHSIAVTKEAYRQLQKTAQRTGIPIGVLATMAVEKVYDPKNNPQVAAALQAAKDSFVNAICN